MRNKTWAFLIASHVAALGLGFALFLPARGKSEDDPLPSAKSSPRHERAERRERSVSTTELLDAYWHPSFFDEARALRTIPDDPGSASPEKPDLSADERAARTEDIPAALDGQLAGVNRMGVYDYQFAKALIRRWLEEDPAACMKWIGGMKMEVGWRDPFKALAEALPADEVLGLMDEDWLARNRRYALSAISEKVGADSPESLPELLQGLETDESKDFLSHAVRHARAEDAAYWLEFAHEREPGILSSLGDRWFRAVAMSWQRKDGELVPVAS